MKDITELLAASPRDLMRIIEYRNRYPKCMTRLSPADAEFVSRIYKQWTLSYLARAIAARDAWYATDHDDYEEYPDVARDEQIALAVGEAAP